MQVCRIVIAYTIYKQTMYVQVKGYYTMMHTLSATPAKMSAHTAKFWLPAYPCFLWVWTHCMACHGLTQIAECGKPPTKQLLTSGQSNGRRISATFCVGSSQNVNSQNVNSQNVNSWNVNSQNVNSWNVNSQNVYFPKCLLPKMSTPKMSTPKMSTLKILCLTGYDRS